jgi:hypothetical protein
MTKRSNPPKSPAKPAKPGRTPKSGEAGEEAKKRPVEIGGRKGPDPTRYGDWEYKGRCIDF